MRYINRLIRTVNIISESLAFIRNATNSEVFYFSCIGRFTPIYLLKIYYFLVGLFENKTSAKCVWIRLCQILKPKPPRARSNSMIGSVTRTYFLSIFFIFCSCLENLHSHTNWNYVLKSSIFSWQFKFSFEFRNSFEIFESRIFNPFSTLISLKIPCLNESL